MVLIISPGRYKLSTTFENIFFVVHTAQLGIRERSHMTSAAEGGGGFKMLTVADKGGGCLSLADVSKNT